MKKNLLAAGLLLSIATCATAQMSLVNPIPQSVTTAHQQLAVPATWRLVYDARRAATPAVKALAKAAPTVDAKAKYTVTLGVAGDKAVGKAAALKAEGYTLTITQKGITLVGADEQGLYYGVQTLLASMAQGVLEVCTVKDWPDVPFRGVVEGFYGTPWSHSARLSQLEFYGRHKLNVYIYGPKDDPYHRDHWRVPYPEEEGKRIRELVKAAQENGVNFYWAIHPGIDIQWTTADRDALIQKLEKMYDLGVRSFAVFFDDIWGEGTRADKQAELLNYIDDHFIQQKHDVSPLVMCPTEYNRAWSDDKKGYLRTLGSRMNKSVHIMWTGNSVVHCIDKESMEWINQRIDRKAYIWWNFPVSDFVRDHILLGPAYGNGLDIAADMAGFVSNPMEHAEASKVALYGIADYTWNMQHYDADTDWERAIAELLPDNARALRTFALYNKDLGQNGHGFRREEGDEIKTTAADALNGSATAVDTLMTKCSELKNAADILLADKSNSELIRELRPWLLQARLLADYGQAVGQMTATADAEDNGALAFTDYYAQAQALQQQMYELENSDVRHPLQPGIKVGTKVLLPTLNGLFTRAVDTYNAAACTQLSNVAEYNPYTLTSTVPQLALLPVTVRGNEVSIAPSNEVIQWPAGGVLTLTADRTITFQGMDFNLGIAGVAQHFRLETLVDGQWTPVSLLHYSDSDPVIHTGNELGGMKASALRLTNISGADQQVYFRSFHFVKQ